MDNGEMFILDGYIAYYNLKNARLNLVTRLRTSNDLNHEDVKLTEGYEFEDEKLTNMVSLRVNT